MTMKISIVIITQTTCKCERDILKESQKTSNPQINTKCGTGEGWEKQTATPAEWGLNQAKHHKTEKNWIKFAVFIRYKNV